MSLPLKIWAKPDRLTQIAADLRAAAALLAETGWIQGSQRDLEGRMCAQGALTTVTQHVSSCRDAFNCRLNLAQGAFYRVSGQHLVNFNDADGQSVTNVIAGLNTVAAECDRAAST